MLSPSKNNNQINYMTVDVEDYFQVSAFENIVGTGKWDNYVPRVVINTQKILSLFEEYNVKGTFFILGWIAEKFPGLVKKIANNGHEIACHSYCHRLVYDLSPDEFREDTKKAKDILEQIIGKKVLGYRAPSYSITRKSMWALGILEELGFQYDSSIFPIYHDRYGIPDAPRFEYQLNDHGMIEYPISTSLFCGRKIPVAGGGYFRILPYWFTQIALRRINEIEQEPFIFYFHPWEIDPDQERLNSASLVSKFRHYINLDKTYGRLCCLLQDFDFRPICDEYVND